MHNIHFRVRAELNETMVGHYDCMMMAIAQPVLVYLSTGEAAIYCLLPKTNKQIKHIQM